MVLITINSEIRIDFLDFQTRDYTSVSFLKSKFKALTSLTEARKIDFPKMEIENLLIVNHCALSLFKEKRRKNLNL